MRSAGHGFDDATVGGDDDEADDSTGDAGEETELLLSVVGAGDDTGGRDATELVAVGVGPSSEAELQAPSSAKPMISEQPTAGTKPRTRRSRVTEFPGVGTDKWSTA